MRQILSSFNVLPKLVEGKVCIITDKGYKLCSVPRTISIEDNFDPIKYCLLNEGQWSDLIVYSYKQEREHFIVNKLYREYVEPINYRKGDKIHIHSRRGIYQVVDINGDFITITCNKWQYKSNPNHIIHRNDFKCLAGGFHNHNF